MGIIVVFAYYLLGGSSKPFAWMASCIEIGGAVFLALIVALTIVAVLAPDPYSARAQEAVSALLDAFVKLVKGLFGRAW